LAQLKIEILSIELSQTAGDEIVSYLDNGKTLTAKKREQAINTAIGSVYEARLGAIGEKQFLKMYPEFGDIRTYTFLNGVPDSRELVKEGDVKRYIRAIINTSNPVISNRKAEPLTEELYTRVKTNKHSNFKPTYSEPKFYETDTIEILVDTLGSRIFNGSARFNVLIQPGNTEFNINGEDIVIPWSWRNEIVTIAKDIALNRRQK